MMKEIEFLIARATSPDVDIAQKHEAFAELVKRFQDMVYGYAYAVLGDFQLAEDAAQEAFIVAYRDLDKLRDAKAFPRWLKRIVLTQEGSVSARRSGGSPDSRACSVFAKHAFGCRKVSP